MIDFFRGKLASKKTNTVVIEVAGIGYSVNITTDTFNKLPQEGTEFVLYIVESTGMYGGVVSHYGFLSVQERDMFILIRDEVPSTGAKKAMEYLDKISKSFADFKSAVVSRDISMLSGIFGFSKKTAEKIVVALKEKIADIVVGDTKKWDNIPQDNINVVEAMEGLVALGYKEFKVREAINKVVTENKNLSVADMIKEALKYL